MAATAEQTAHLRTFLQSKPSVFELVAQQSLHDSLYPALSKVVQQLARFDWKGSSALLRNYDQLYLLLDVSLQYYCLRRNDASFAEYFYGLERAPVVGVRHGDHKLPTTRVGLSIFLLSVVPYLKRKLHDKIDRYREQVSDSFAKRFLVFLVSSYRAGERIYVMRQLLMYMSGSTDSQSFGLQLIDSKLVYSAERRRTDGAFWTCLETFAFLVQFLHAWNLSSGNSDFPTLPITSPPSSSPFTPDTYTGTCPICLQKWQIPTALSVSGYVYCFSCIHARLKDEQCCPITRYPADARNLIRLYDDDDDDCFE